MAEDQERTVVQPQQWDDSGRTQALNRPDATQMGASVECPVCLSRNIPSETYCSDCGFLLSSTPGEEAPEAQGPSVALTNTRTRQKFELAQGTYSVGRENADVLLSDPSVSRRHAEIRVTDDGAVVQDLGSTNGTSVGSHRLAEGEEAVLEDGQEVRFGNSVLTVEIAAPEPEEDQADEEAADVQPDAEAESEKESEQPDYDTAEAAIADPGASVAADEVYEAEDEPAEVPKAEPADSPYPLEAALVEVESGERHLISPEGANIGRRDSNDIVLANPYVSSNHAIIAVDGNSYVLTDIGSTNGTMVNGQQLAPQTPVRLQPGDKIAMGQLELVFEMEGEPGDE